MSITLYPQTQEATNSRSYWCDPLFISTKLENMETSTNLSIVLVIKAMDRSLTNVLKLFTSQ